MKQIIVTAFFVSIWSGLLPVECFGVEIPLNEIINEQHFQDKIEPGALRDGNLTLSDFAYDLAPYVQRYFTVDWYEQLRFQRGRGQGDWGKAVPPNGLNPFPKPIAISTDDLSSCVIAVEINKLRLRKPNLNFPIKASPKNLISAQKFISKHFFIFTDVLMPPNSEIFDTGQRYPPLGYSFPAIETLPEDFAGKWGKFLEWRAKAADSKGWNNVNEFYPFSKWAICTNFHLCSLKRPTPKSIELLCRVATTGGVKHKFCLCGLQEIDEELAGALVRSECHFWLSSHTEVSEEAEAILRKGNGDKVGTKLAEKKGLNSNRFTLCLDPVGPRNNRPARGDRGRDWGNIVHFGPQYHERFSLPKGFSFAVLEGRCLHLRSFSKVEVEDLLEKNNLQKKQRGVNQAPKGELPDRSQNRKEQTQFNRGT